MPLEEELSQKRFKNQHQKALINLVYTTNWLSTHQKAFFDEYEITPQQYNMLRILRGQAPDPCTINLLKSRMIDRMCDASRLVDRLEEKNLLTRTTNAEDRRAVDIHISEKGLELLSIIDERIGELEKLIINLAEDEVVTLNTLLDKIRDQAII